MTDTPTIEVRVSPDGQWHAARVHEGSHPWLLVKRMPRSEPSGFYPDFEVEDWPLAEVDPGISRGYKAFGAQFPTQSGR